MSDSNRSGFVTWRAFLLLLGVSISTPIVVDWTLLQHHASQPHSNAASIRDMDRIDRVLDRIEDKITANRKEMSANHKEILQRIAALEAKIDP